MVPPKTECYVRVRGLQWAHGEEKGLQTALLTQEIEAKLQQMDAAADQLIQFTNVEKGVSMWKVKPELADSLSAVNNDVSNTTEKMGVLLMNVGGLTTPEKQQQLLQIVHRGPVKPGLVAISESWLEGANLENFANRAKNYNLVTFGRGRPNRTTVQASSQVGGVALCVHQSLGKAKLMADYSCEGLLWVEIDNAETKLYVAVVYMPPAESKFKTEAEEIWKCLKKGIKHFKAAGGIVLVLGDFNARCADESGILAFPRRSMDTTMNPRGKNLVNLAKKSKMVIVNGVQRTTGETAPAAWTNRMTNAMGPEKTSVVDYILIDEKFHALLGDMKVIAEARELMGKFNGHEMVYCTMDMKPLAETEQFTNEHPRTKPIVSRRQITNAKLQAMVEAAFKEANLEGKADWEDFKRTLRGVGERVDTQIATNNPRWHALDAELTLLRQQLPPLAGDEHQRARQKIHKKMKHQRAKITRERIRMRAEGMDRADNTYELWATIKQVCQLNSNKTAIRANFGERGVRDQGGKLQTGQAVGEVAATYFQKLGNPKEEDDAKFDRSFKEAIETRYERIVKGDAGTTVSNLGWATLKSSPPTVAQELLRTEVMTGAPTIEEIKARLLKLKTRKAADREGLFNELFMNAGDQTIEALHKLFTSCWETASIPSEWATGMIVPIFKDGDPELLDNYRGITLLSVVGKLYTGVLQDRLLGWCEENGVIVEEQGGFRRDRGCQDQLFVLNSIIQGRARQGKQTFCCFIDVKKAYDSVWRKNMMAKLFQAGISNQMFRVIDNMYAKVESCVCVNGYETRLFDYTVGVRQGCVLSPLLFSLVINELVLRMNLRCPDGGVTLDNGATKIRLLLYADDIVLIAEDATTLQSMMDVVTAHAKETRYEINAKKSKVVVFRPHVVPAKKKKYKCYLCKRTSAHNWTGCATCDERWFCTSCLDANLDASCEFMQHESDCKKEYRKQQKKMKEQELNNNNSNSSSNNNNSQNNNNNRNNSVNEVHTHSNSRSPLPWMLGGHALEETDEYKYLGVWFQGDCNWDTQRASIAGRIRNANRYVYNMGKNRSCVPMKCAVLVFEAFVKSVCEYGDIVWASGKRREWESINTLYKAGLRNLLAVGNYTPIYALQGELGRLSLDGVIQYNRVKWLVRLKKMSPVRFCARVYQWDTFQASMWCQSTEQLYTQWALTTQSSTMEIKKQSHLAEMRALNLQYQSSDNWALYGKLKESLSREGYLEDNTMRWCRSQFTEIRANCWMGLAKARFSRLFSRKERAIQGQELVAGVRPMQESDGMCPHCDDKALETAEHCMVQCPAWDSARRNIREAFIEHSQILMTNVINEWDPQVNEMKERYVSSNSLFQAMMKGGERGMKPERRRVWDQWHRQIKVFISKIAKLKKKAQVPFHAGQLKVWHAEQTAKQDAKQLAEEAAMQVRWRESINWG